MASVYPASLDSLATTRSDATLSAANHAADHDNIADAVNKIEAELGTYPRVQMMGPGAVNAHSPRYNVPTDGATNAVTTLAAAIAGTPVGGTCFVGPYELKLDAAIGADLSTRPDVTVKSWGGSKVGNYSGAIKGASLVAGRASMTVLKCAPAVMTEYGPTIENIAIHNESGFSAVQGLYLQNCVKSTLRQFGARYCTNGGIVYQALGGVGEDNAWHHWEDITVFTPAGGDAIILDGIFGLTMDGIIDLELADSSSRGIVGRNYAQNVKISGLNIDGHEGATGQGIGVDIEATGAHDWDIFGPKIEACGTGYRYRSPNSGVASPTRAIKVWGGSVSSYSATTEVGFDLGQYCDGILLNYPNFPNFQDAAHQVVQNVGATNVTWNKLIP